jgi:hypothetical protein
LHASVSLIRKYVEPHAALRKKETRESRSVVGQKGFVVGVNHMLNVDSIPPVLEG